MLLGLCNSHPGSCAARRVGRPQSIMETRMNDQFTRQAQDMFAAAKEARIPENVQAFAEESVAKTRDAYTKLNAATQDSVKAVEEIVLAAQAGAKSFSEKFI